MSAAELALRRRMLFAGFAHYLIDQIIAKAAGKFANIEATLALYEVQR